MSEPRDAREPVDPSGGGIPMREYDVSGASPLVALINNPWHYILDVTHRHNCMEIGKCVTGAGWVTMGGQTWHFEPGCVIVTPKGLPHSQHNEGPRMAHWHYVVVNEDLLLREAPERHRQALEKTYGDIAGRGLFLGAAEQYSAIRDSIDRLFAVRPEENMAAGLEQEARLFLLLALLMRLSNQPLANREPHAETRDVIEPALNYVVENYAQEIRISDLAASCAMSESYFRKVFSQIMNMSPLEYINRYRVNRSMVLLRNTNETVLSIAGQTGFPSIATYNRNFQRYTGSSPAEWRKNAHR